LSRKRLDTSPHFRNFFTRPSTTQAELDALNKEIDKAEKRAAKVKPKSTEFADIDQNRRDVAFWAKTPKEYYDKFIKETGEMWNRLSVFEKEALYYYTHIYCPINEPLRGKQYIGSDSKRKEALSKIPHITSAIQKSEISEDVWLMRGDSDADVIKSRFGIDIDGMTESQAVTALLGKEGIEKAFLSCGSSKGTGFSSKDIITNIFVPKGTKGIYVEPISAFGNGSDGANWDGKKRQKSVSKENETILQRGTKFRITKVENRAGKWYIDVDVIGQEPQPY